MWWQPEEKVEVEYVSEQVGVDANGIMNALVQEFQEVFEKFVGPEQMFLEATKVCIFFLSLMIHASNSYGSRSTSVFRGGKW